MLKNRLKELRTEYNITQEELAKAIQRTRSSITAYESGSKEPTIDTVILLSEFFNVTTDYLLGVSNVRNYSSFPYQNSSTYLRALKAKYDNLDVNYKKVASAMSLTLMDNLLELQLESNSKELDPNCENTLKIAETHEEIVPEKEQKRKAKKIIDNNK